MRIGLYFDEILDWQGGRDLARMMYQNLLLAQEDEDEFQVVTRNLKDAPILRTLRILKHLVCRWPWDLDWVRREAVRSSRRDYIAQILGHIERLKFAPFDNADLSDWIRRASFDVVGPFQHVPPRKRGWVGYLPDCQHKRLPHFFDERECERRDVRFSQMLAEAPVVVVSSRDTAKDLEEFFGPSRAAIIAVPFAAAPEPTWFTVDENEVRRQYGLPKRFFICCNQFWSHKNHIVVFESLQVARRRGRPFFVVFTGEVRDFKDRGHVARLMERVDALGISSDFKLLGLIPKLDQIALLKASQGVIQPTLFEGAPGGGVSYEAVALGKRVILSDIPVNREIVSAELSYFNPHDPEALADIVIARQREQETKRLAEDLVRTGLERRQKCGQVLRAAFSKAAGAAGLQHIG